MIIGNSRCIAPSPSPGEEQTWTLFLFPHLFTWLHPVLAAALGIFNLQHAGSCSLIEQGWNPGPLLWEWGV